MQKAYRLVETPLVHWFANVVAIAVALVVVFGIYMAHRLLVTVNNNPTTWVFFALWLIFPYPFLRWAYARIRSLGRCCEFSYDSESAQYHVVNEGLDITFSEPDIKRVQRAKLSIARGPEYVIHLRSGQKVPLPFLFSSGPVYSALFHDRSSWFPPRDEK